MTRFSLAVRAVVVLGSMWGAVPASAANAAGHVQSASGNVQIERPGQPAEALLQGMTVGSGDTLVTGPQSTLTVRMRNGELMIFRPDTRFVIEQFRMPILVPQPATGRSFYSLLRGGFRAITSAIQPRGMDSYRIKTPVATIGIRGTVIDVFYSDRLHVGVERGSINLVNEGGSLIVNAGQYAQVLNAATAPGLLSAAPATLGGGAGAGAGSGAAAGGTATGTGVSAGAAGATGTLSGTTVGLGALGLIGLAAIIVGNDDGSTSTSTSPATSP